MRLRLVSVVIVIAVGVLAALAWQRNTAPPATQAAPEAASQAPPTADMPMSEVAAPSGSGPDIEWQTPKRWVTQLAQGMRFATYVIPARAAGGEPAECAVYYFGPGQGGGVDANVERWIGEFQNPGTPKRRTREVNGLKISEVEVTGSYTAHAMSPGEAQGVKAGWTLHGAIVEAPAGAVFFKLTGPGTTVSAAAKEFDGLLASVCKKT